ncbi:MAG: hypothetical protein K2O78_00305 [Muribaculaceae bacterium]|nr:hypothetical protein [Muribaculaceae bacterium]MDE7080085.1 hypothetical protein [Muribaculaceae bacterium]
MKKIFTTLAAALMVAVSANATVTVTNNGEPVADGAEIVLTADDFEYFEIPEIDYYLWEAHVTLDVTCAAPGEAKAEATDADFQFCPDGNCIPFPAEAPFVVSKANTSSSYNVPIHYDVKEKDLGKINESMVCTFSDADNSVSVTIKVAVEDNGVNEIMASSANIAGIYDLQGRRVRDDYRGVAIVVYDNGKAVKQVIK